MGERKVDNTLYLFEIGDTVTLKPKEVLFHPDWPAPNFDDEEFIALKNNIEQCGQLIPILIKKKEHDQNVVVDGERRLYAIQQLGLPGVFCIYIDASEDMTRYIVNRLRKTQTAMQEAEVMQRIMSTERINQKQLAKIIGKAVSTVTEILTLNKLPDYIKDKARHDKRISRAALLKLHSDFPESERDKQKRYFDMFVSSLDAHEGKRNERNDKISKFYDGPQYPIKKFNGTVAWMGKYFANPKVTPNDKLTVYQSLKKEAEAMLVTLEQYKANLGLVDSDDKVA